MKMSGVLRNWALAFIAPRPLIGLAYLPRYFAHWVRYRDDRGSLSAADYLDYGCGLYHFVKPAEIR